MAVEQYMEQAAARLVADGNDVTFIEVRDRRALIGYQSEFRLRWFATKLHLFVVVVPVPDATEDELTSVTDAAIEHAVKTKGKLRGLQTGVAVITVLVSPRVSDEAAAAVRRRPQKKWAVFTMPAIVDVTRNETFVFEGTIIWGRSYAKWLRATPSLRRIHCRGSGHVRHRQIAMARA